MFKKLPAVEDLTSKSDWKTWSKMSVVAALALGSWGMWTAPASAAILERGCLPGELGSANEYVNIFWGSFHPIAESTMTGDIDEGLVLSWKFGSYQWPRNFNLTLSFYDNDPLVEDGETDGCGEDPDREAPDNLCFTFTATGDDGVEAPYTDLDSNPVDNERPLSLEINEVRAVSYPEEEDAKILIEFDESHPFSNSFELSGTPYPVQEWEFSFGFDDSNVNPPLKTAIEVTLTMTITRCGDTPPTGPETPNRTPGAWNIDDYRPIGIAESGALPDTI
jgi:hypothetical protein